jgi:L,D-transpeptidase catalytic domain/Ankyrin repeats (3 copies)
MLGIGLSFHRAEVKSPIQPAMRLPSLPTGRPAIAAQAPSSTIVVDRVQSGELAMSTVALPQIKQLSTEPAYEVRAASPVSAIPVSLAPDNTPRAMLLNPLPSPEYRPFRDSLSSILRATPPRAEGIPTVYQSVLFGDNEWLLQLLRSGYSPDEPTAAGDTALCAAVWFGNEECVNSLLLHGANPNLPGREGQPPLALASLRRSNTILKALLLAGADVNSRFVYPVPKSVLETVTVNDLKGTLQSDRGVTPLIACTARGDVEGVLLLMQHGARANVPTTKDFRYPINFACTQKYLFLSRILLGRSPDSEPDLLVTVDLSQQRAWITRNGSVVDSTTISTGREGHATPTGRYLVTDKHREWISTLYKVPMPWFMRLDCSAIGLHSGHVTGRPASHGCIRLPPEKAKSFFGVVSVGDEVQIVR